MKITIIGCGYVGKAIAQLWTKKGYQVTVTTTTPEKVTDLEQISSKVVVMFGDNLEAMREVITDTEVILLSIGAKNRNAYREIYLNTAKTLVNALQNNDTVKQIIYTGSYAVLGDKQGEWVNETTQVTPTNENSEILINTENTLLSTSTDKLKVCILRLGGIYGPGREIIKIFRTWSGTTRPGSGEDYTNWIHLDDIVGALKLIEEQKLAGIYHLADDTPMTTKKFYQRLFECHQISGITWDASTPSVRPYNVRLSNQKIKAAGLTLIHPETIF